MITADQLVCHLIGDYVLQSDWMAARKRQESAAAALHAFAYALPFVVLGVSGLAWVVIVGTHFVIDRWGLARYVVWAKNFLAPRTTVEIEYVPAFVTVAGKELHDERTHLQRWWHPWRECRGTGYPPARPVWLATWLLIIADNVLHIVINGAAIAWWPQ